MNAKKEASEQIANLVQALVEDVEQASDAELIQEVRADGQNADAVADRVAAGIAVAIGRHGKAVLARAHRHVRDEHARRLSSASNVLSLEEKRSIVARFAASDAGLKAKLTMAARSGQAPTESDLDSMLQDLRDLGVIEEEGDGN